LSAPAYEALASKASLSASREAKFTESKNAIHAAVTNQNSFLRLLQGAQDVELDDICQDLLSTTGDRCTCAGLSNGNVRLTCPDTYCRRCDESFETCGFMTYSSEHGPNGAPPDYFVGSAFSFEYTTGETVAVEKSACDAVSRSCTECVALVNGEVCTSCSMCNDGYSFTVDCENLATSSSFSECSEDVPENGIFQGLGFYTCQYVEPTNDACSTSTLIRFGQASIGRTTGATQGSISSSCSLDDAKDVWYSVVGTGDTIVATTCSYETYVGTIIDVFSGPDSCEDLECVAATASDCAAGYVGGTVSWPSDPGVSYHLRVATVDFEDQFELVVWDVPPAENTACIASVAATFVDALGITMDLSDQLETDTCGEIGTPGLWYQVTAVEDGIMRASTISNNTSIDTAITVMIGSDCDTLTCVKSVNQYESNVGYPEIGVFVDWNVTLSETYFVYIRGTNSTGLFGVSTPRMPQRII
jgi:hypothetical protein